MSRLQMFDRALNFSRMKMIGVCAALLAVACGGADLGSESPTGSTSSAALGGTPTHDEYTCTIAPGAAQTEFQSCVNDFKTGSGSDCVFTCNDGTCQIVRAGTGPGYENVAFCVAPNG